ncbi:DUF805 domain-containing protein [Pseudomonas sp. UL073]|uniref:DUF805 domain-containing protein n=1 Tax=Zestomonas insulae TaxID=2809017 RepID=A0ABS2IGK2_9GAMM|nr:DUF805 domain-containing protein [Pseudomonas insulae]MBM7062201.1 DUF805 domain-containing protein [Pseudomonas insulae]
MSDTRYKIVFDGELMPEMSLDTVKDNLARLFKLDRARVEPLFGRQAVVLKRDLPAGEVDKYVSALERAGAQVRKEQDLAASLSLVETEEHQPEETARMQCPKCGHEQTKAIECSACGIVIDKYLARQAQLAENPAPEPEPPRDTPPASPYTPPQAQVGEELPEFGDLNVFSVQGRIGRLRYLAWTLVVLLASVGLFGLAMIGMGIHQMVGWTLISVVGIAIVVVSLMIGVQRLHDIGWSGWLLLLNIIPVVGSVLSLLMLLVPGTTGVNRFGPPPPANSTAVKVLAALWLLPIAAALLVVALGGAAALSGLGEDFGLQNPPATQETPANAYGEE